MLFLVFVLFCFVLCLVKLGNALTVEATEHAVEDAFLTIISGVNVLRNDVQCLTQCLPCEIDVLGLEFIHLGITVEDIEAEEDMVKPTVLVGIGNKLSESVLVLLAILIVIIGKVGQECQVLIVVQAGRKGGKEVGLGKEGHLERKVGMWKEGRDTHPTKSQKGLSIFSNLPIC